MINAGAAGLSPVQTGMLAGGFLLAAMAKSAQVPFAPWLARAMEGPTPSSALFYGAVMIHAGVYLLPVSYTHLDVYKRQARQRPCQDNLTVAILAVTEAPAAVDPDRRRAGIFAGAVLLASIGLAAGWWFGPWS